MRARRNATVLIPPRASSIPRLHPRHTRRTARGPRGPWVAVAFVPWAKCLTLGDVRHRPPQRKSAPVVFTTPISACCKLPYHVFASRASPQGRALGAPALCQEMPHSTYAGASPMAATLKTTPLRVRASAGRPIAKAWSHATVSELLTNRARSKMALRRCHDGVNVRHITSPAASAAANLHPTVPGQCPGADGALT